MGPASKRGFSTKGSSILLMSAHLQYWFPEYFLWLSGEILGHSPPRPQGKHLPCHGLASIRFGSCRLLHVPKSQAAPQGWSLPSSARDRLRLSKGRSFLNRSSKIDTCKRGFLHDGERRRRIARWGASYSEPQHCSRALGATSYTSTSSAATSQEAPKQGLLLGAYAAGRTVLLLRVLCLLFGRSYFFPAFSLICVLVRLASGLEVWMGPLQVAVCLKPFGPSTVGFVLKMVILHKGAGSLKQV